MLCERFPLAEADKIEKFSRSVYRLQSVYASGNFNNALNGVKYEVSIEVHKAFYQAEEKKNIWQKRIRRTMYVFFILQERLYQIQSSRWRIYRLHAAAQFLTVFPPLTLLAGILWTMVIQGIHSCVLIGSLEDQRCVLLWNIRVKGCSCWFCSRFCSRSTCPLPCSR